MIQYIPKVLLYGRLVISVLILSITFVCLTDASIYIFVLMLCGILSDIFDGILARKLQTSNLKFRIWDTIIDLIFYISVFMFIIDKNHELIKDHLILILVILTLESFMYFISFFRFKRLPSPHAILSKFWGLYLVIEFSLIILHVPGLHFRIALLFGILAHIDRVLIYLLLRKWDHDIPSSYHALLIRRGIPIVRKKLFNG